MRRPLLILFIILISLSYIFTVNKKLDKYDEDFKIKIIDVVKDKKEKEKYTQYIIGDYLVNDYNRKFQMQIGNLVEIDGEYKDLDKMILEDFNYGRYIKSCGYKGIINCNYCKVLDINRFYSIIGNIKIYCRNTLRYLYKDKSDFLNSVILGIKEDLDDEERDIFTKTGTSHIIAISGLHMGIICAIIAYLIKGINKLYKLCILAFILTIYGVIVGFGPSVTRAIVFVIIMYLSIFLFEKRDGITTLSLIGSVLIIDNPYIIYNISFELSFFATLSILYFNKSIKEKLKIDIVSMTISANILTLPIIYYVFKGISVLSIVGNIIIIPFIGIIMNLSILSILFFKLSLNITKVIVYINKSIINMVYYILINLAKLDLGYINIERPNLMYVIIYYVLIFSYMIYREIKTMKEQKNEIQGYY